MNTLAILIPGPIGYHLFVRTPRDRLRRFSQIVAPLDLLLALGPLDDPLLVVLVGTRKMDEVAAAVGFFADVIALPDPWLARVPRRNLTLRANVAAQIATAHARAPLLHHQAGHGDGLASIPF